MPKLTVRIDISSEDYLSWYRGRSKQVLATTLDGLKVQFPANILQSFVGHNGVKGTFQIEFEDAPASSKNNKAPLALGKFRSIQRLA